METDKGGSHIYTPINLPELLLLYKRYPQALLYGGGTQILKKQEHKIIRFPPTVIYLKRVEELKRISRTERYLELGAGITVDRVLTLGTILPEAFLKALKAIEPVTIRNMKTLGGLVFQEGTLTRFAAVLFLLDIRVELKSFNSSKWILLNRLYNQEGIASLQAGEIISRIRIPLENWNYQVYKQILAGSSFQSDHLAFCGLAKTHKGVLSDLRFAFSNPQRLIVRIRELEAEIIGRKIPLNPKDFNILMGLLEAALKELEQQLTPFQLDRIKTLTYWFLKMIPSDGG